MLVNFSINAHAIRSEDFIHSLKSENHLVKHNVQRTGKNCVVAFIWMVRMVMLRIPTKDSKVIITSYSVINVITGKNCSVA